MPDHGGPLLPPPEMYDRRASRDHKRRRARRQRRIALAAVVLVVLAVVGAVVAAPRVLDDHEPAVTATEAPSEASADTAPDTAEGPAARRDGSSASGEQPSVETPATGELVERASTARAPVKETHAEKAAPQPPKPAPAAGGSLAGLRVNLDAGHNGGNSAAFNSQVPPATQQLLDAGVQLSSPQCDTSGTSTNAGYPESAFTLDVARRTKAELERRGATVAMTRDSNETQGPCTFERAAIGNQADVAVSIHADGSGASNRGFHVIPPAPLRGYTDDITDASADLARDVRAAVLTTGMPTANYIGRDGIDPRANLVGLVLSNVPKVFLESGNMRNATDAALLTNPEYRQQLAVALADAIGVWAAGR